MQGELTGGAHVNNRMCAAWKLLLNAIAAAAGGAPHILDPATYAAAATAKRGDAPQQLATGIWFYRPTQDVKILALTFLSDTGADNGTAVYDIHLFPRIPTSADRAIGKRHRVTLTLGSLTNLTQLKEPFTGVDLGGSKTLRHYDTAVWSYRDTGDLQVYDKGFDALNNTGTIYIDMTGFDSVVICLQTMPGSSVRELVGMAEECS